MACRGVFPPRKVNGGLYTGEPFQGDWGNRPFFPDQGYIANANLFRGGLQTSDGARPFNTAMRIVGRVYVPELNTYFPAEAPSAGGTDSIEE